MLRNLSLTTLLVSSLVWVWVTVNHTQTSEETSQHYEDFRQWFLPIFVMIVISLLLTYHNFNMFWRVEHFMIRFLLSFLIANGISVYIWCCAPLFLRNDGTLQTALLFKFDLDSFVSTCACIVYTYLFSTILSFRITNYCEAIQLSSLVICGRKQTPPPNGFVLNV
jgi:hypothetical protein